MQKAIKLMIVDDHNAVRQALSAILKEFEFPTIYEASNGKEAIELLEETTPDVVLLDLNMPVMNGFEALTIIKQKYPSVKVIILSGHSDKSYVNQTLQSGADAFLPKQCSIEVLIEVVENVYNDKPFVYEDAIGSVLPTYPGKQELDLIKEQRSLSAEEVDVLIAMCEGKSQKVISEELNMSVRTVVSHTEAIYKKTLLSTKVALLKYAFRNGYIQLSENV